MYFSGVENNDVLLFHEGIETSLIDCVEVDTLARQRTFA